MSNKTQHTTAPWEYEEHHDGGFKVWGDKVVTAGCAVSHEVASTRNEANARLIAAAPELLAALRELSEATTLFMRHPSDSSASWKAAESRWRQSRGDALDVIAKATGG